MTKKETRHKKRPPQEGRRGFAHATDAQQRKECHVRFDASVGVHSQSLGHRHVGNPATASVAHTLGEML